MLLGIILLLCSFSRTIVCKSIPTSNANCKVLGEHVLGNIYEIRMFDYPFTFDKSLEYDSCEHSFTDGEEPNEVRPAGRHYSNAHVFFETWWFILSTCRAESARMLH